MPSVNYKLDVKDFVFSWKWQNLIGPLLEIEKNCKQVKGQKRENPYTPMYKFCACLEREREREREREVYLVI